VVSAIIQYRETRYGLGVIRVGAPGPTASEVVGHLQPEDPASVMAAAEVLDGYDVVGLQHEYGIYGPDSGASVLDLVRLLRSPLVTTLHTVLAVPSPQQFHIMRELAHQSALVIVMTRTAARRLVDLYRVSSGKIRVIPHGTNGFPTEAIGVLRRKPRILTWGLVGPGKGLEWAIEAMSHLSQMSPTYVIAGQTHPAVIAREGEVYRRGLENLAQSMGIAHRVEFVPRYLDAVTLGKLVHGADAVLLPYESTEQVTSGVLMEAVAAGVPVVATRFPHAVELASEGAVIAVPHRDPRSIAHALTAVLTSSPLRSRMLAVQRRIGRASSWSRVGADYEMALSDAARRVHAVA
jgi:glycosyltransferase involved in cell wall biosynthesis